MSAPGSVVLGRRYELGEKIGAGGFSEVWRATDVVLARPVAIKLLHLGYAQHAEALTRFRAEAQHAGGLSHENIARVYDYGEPDPPQPPYLVMEFVDGPSLAGMLAAGPLDPARSLDIIAQTASGLHAAHLIGGLVLLFIVVLGTSKRRELVDVAANYWHFLGVLWLVLFYVLMTA